MGTRDVHIFIHRGRDSSETKHDPKNGQFAAGGSSGKKSSGSGGSSKEPEPWATNSPDSVVKANIAHYAKRVAAYERGGYTPKKSDVEALHNARAELKGRKSKTGNAVSIPG
jgi:hypothetical protein